MASSQGKGYKAWPDAVPAAVVPRPRTVHVRTDQCPYPASPLEGAVLTLEKQRVGWGLSVERNRVAGKLEEVWLEEEEGTWPTAEFWLEC